jgi:serpin B
MPFNTSEDEQLRVPMMHQNSNYRYIERPGLKVLEMPYEGGDLSMVIFLPSAPGGLEEAIVPTRIPEWLSELDAQQEREVQVWLPQFTMKHRFVMNEQLRKLGMVRAFGNADFSGMTGGRDLFISQVIHKAFVEVNEEGTEAAAATGVVMTRAMPRRLTFRADHPFVFLIRDRATGSILFMGRLLKPARR